MLLKIQGSASSGNSYLFESGSECLIIDAGIPFLEIKKALNFNISKIVGVCIDHEHGDHSKYVKEYSTVGIPIYGSAGTLKALNIAGRIMHPGCAYSIGGFTVKGFDVIHDAAEPFGFILFHKEMGLTCFITDTCYSKYRFPGVNHFLCEANYDQQILDNNILNGRLPAVVRNRIMRSHMSLQTCKEMLAANDLSQTRNIVLIHLSDGNSNAAEFKKDIEGLTGKPTYIADKGLVIDLNKNPF